jgi:hypothetical protein
MKWGWRARWEKSWRISTQEVQMPSPSHETYRKSVQTWVGKSRHDPDWVMAFERYAEAAQVLWHLDLEPARPILMQGYAENPRGGRPWDPVVLFRALLLSILVGQPKINKWVKDLKASRVLQVLCGIGMDGRPGAPGVGTFYDFMHRLNDGPNRRPCAHIERASDSERRRSASPQARQKPKDKDRAAVQTIRGRKALGARRPARTVTAQLVNVLNEQQVQPNPNDLLGRLSNILIEVAVKVSAEKGLLGEIEALPVSGDGSPLKTGGSRHGRRICDCPKQKRCDCPRRYSDPDANIGWDSHRERFFYGHHIYEIVASNKKHDLPVALRLDPASTSDFVAVLKSIEHLRKTCRDTNIATLAAVMLDAGHDGEEIYRYLIKHDMLPIIPLKISAPAYHPTRKKVALSRRGVPKCESGAEMVAWAQKRKESVVYVCPVKAGELDVCPQAPADFPRYRCRPVEKLAPTVTLRFKDNPRLCPPLPRNHKRFKKLMKLRSGSERSFSFKKQRFQLEQARHRRHSFWLIRLHLMAVLQHAMAWVSKEDPQAFVGELIGLEPDRVAA